MEKDLRVVFFSLEFLGPLFSGNGQYSRCLVRGLKAHGAHVGVVSGAGAPMGAQDAEARSCAAAPHAVWDVQLPHFSRHDRHSCWEAFEAGAAAHAAAVAAWAPSLLLCVDWAGAAAAAAAAAACPQLKAVPYG